MTITVAVLITGTTITVAVLITEVDIKGVSTVFIITIEKNVWSQGVVKWIRQYKLQRGT